MAVRKKRRIIRNKHKVIRKGARSGYAQGYASGYAAGYGYGYHYGRSKSIIAHSPVPAASGRPRTIVYVAEGTLGFKSLDIGIVSALTDLGHHVIRAEKTDPVAEISAACRPDLVLVLNGINSIGTDQVGRIREAGIPVAVWVADDPYFSNQTRGISAHYDYVFTHELSCVPMYREAGIRYVHYLPFAASPQVFRPFHVSSEFRRDICVIGSAFANRIQMFNQLTDLFRESRTFIAGRGWDALNDYRLLQRSISLAEIDPLDVPNYYNGAKIVINLHRSAEEAGNSGQYPGLSINPRTFEINACSTLQLVDRRSELARSYEPGREIETFDSPQELKAKVRYYLRREAERREIALQGLKRTMRNHTYAHRMAEMLATIDGWKEEQA